MVHFRNGALFILIAALAGGCSRNEPGGATLTGEAAAGPKLVMIIVDTLRADRMSSYGYPALTSPELDAFAEDGVRFDRAIAPSSWTRTSVGAIVTGYYPRTLGLYKERGEILGDRFVTLAEIFKENGYATFGVTANPNLNSVFNFDQGFDEYVDSHIIYTWMKPASGDLDRKNTKLMSAREVFARALDFAGGIGEGSAYLQLDIMETHEYYRGKEALTRREFSRQFRGTETPAYDRALRQASADTGEFVEELTALPGWENTRFVFLSDHGEALKSHPGVNHKGYHGRMLYESQVRVPLILYAKNWRPENPVVERPVRLLDVMPTILDWMNIPIPEGLDAISLFPLTQDEKAAVGLPSNFVTETEFMDVEKIAVYSPNWKYIQNRDGLRDFPAEELQPIGPNENGRKTDQLKARTEATAALRRHLEDWELAHPKIAPTRAEEELSEEEEEQLKAIGYIE